MPKKIYAWDSIRDKFMASKFEFFLDWWNEVLKKKITRTVIDKGHIFDAEKRELKEKIYEEAKRYAIDKAKRNDELAVSMEEAVKLESRLFYGLQSKLLTKEKIEALSVKDIGALQDILYKFMGKPTLITQNNENITIKTVQSIVEELSRSGAINDPFAKDKNIIEGETV